MDTMDDHKDPQTYAILGAAMEVHSYLGNGFLEPVYQEALAIELTTREIPYQREVVLRVHYKEQTLESFYRADFICYEDVLMEIKALEKLGPNEQAQLINYLKASGIRRGLLINFGSKRLEFKRLVWG